MVDEYSLQYDLLPPSEKIDVWSFGCLLLALCSGGPLFKVNRSNDLDEMVESWDKTDVENAVKKVADPLAQDLLIKLLVREEDRLNSMKPVLRHPFFGSTSNLEALKILEKHEEQQLLLEETTNIPLVTAETQSKLEQSTEKHCKIVFETSDVVAPTCLMALPYQLKWSITENRLVAPSFNNCQKTAQTIGKHLLDMNAATARLSFWLAMKKNFVDNNDGFKDKLTSWLQRGHHTETKAELIEVAKEVVAAIGYNEQYVGICLEMLQVQGEFNTHRFIKDPMGVAKESIQEITAKLHEMYSQPHNSVFLYLMDEYSGVPVLARPKDDVYPILIHPSLLSTFLPFMNISAMAQTAVQGVKGLANLLGLNYDNIPMEWKNENNENNSTHSHIHRLDQPSSVAEFAVLQDVLEKLDPQGYLHNSHSNSHSVNSVSNNSYTNDNMSIGAGMSVAMSTTMSNSNTHSVTSNTTSSSKLRSLESFFRERDQSRTFSGLRRLCDGKGASPAMWTTNEVIQMIQDQALQASLEQRLKNLKAEWLKREQLQVEIAFTCEHLKTLCPNSKIAAEALSDLNLVTNNNTPVASPAKDEEETKKSEADARKAALEAPKDKGKGKPRKRSSWNFGRRPSFQARESVNNSPNDNNNGTSTSNKKRTVRKRQSWSAFEMPKNLASQNDDDDDDNEDPAMNHANQHGGKQLKMNDPPNNTNKKPKRRQSFTNFIRKRLPSADAAEASARAKYNKIQQSQQTPANKQRPNARKRQSWSAFPSRKNSSINNDPHHNQNHSNGDDYDDDMAMFAATRQRSPSVDSIFRRPSTELGANVNVNPNPNNAGRRSSSDNLAQQQQQQAAAGQSNTNNNSNGGTVRRSSWTDKLKSTFGGGGGDKPSKHNRPAPLIDDPNPTFEEDEPNSSNNALPRRRRSSANQRRSWRDLFGGNNTNAQNDKNDAAAVQNNQKVTVRPPPLIDDPDPDADDDEEYYRRPRRPIQVTGMFRDAIMHGDDESPDPYSTVVNNPSLNRGAMSVSMSIGKKSSNRPTGAGAATDYDADAVPVYLDANHNAMNMDVNHNNQYMYQEKQQQQSVRSRSRLSLKGMFQRQRSGNNAVDGSNDYNNINSKRGRRRSKSEGASDPTLQLQTQTQTAAALYTTASSRQPQPPQQQYDVNTGAKKSGKNKFRLPKIGRRRSRSVPERRSSSGVGHQQDGEQNGNVNYNGRSGGYGVVM